MTNEQNVVKTLNQADLPSLLVLQPEGWSTLDGVFLHYIESGNCHPVKLEEEGNNVGIGATIVHNDVAWLGHIIVHPEKRNKGLGKIIVQQLITIAKANNCRTIYLLATALGAPVYEKVGFITETEYLVYKGIHLKNNTTESSFIVPFQDRFKQQILSLDRETSSENRSILLEKYLNDSMMYLEDETVTGYYLPSLGDGLIIAKTPAAGLALTKLHLRKQDCLIFPQDNINLVNFLSDNGHTATSSTKRMRLGDSLPLKMENIYNRIGGNLG